MPARVAISDRKAARIKGLYEEDLLFATEIAERLGLTRTIVKRVLHELGVKSRGTYRPPGVGTKFNNGQLTVTRLAPPGIGGNGWRETRVWVHCKCNGPRSNFVVAAYKLRSGNVKSCGCLWLGSPQYRPNPDREWFRITRIYLNNHQVFTLAPCQVKYICQLSCFYCGAPPGNELMGRRNRVSTGQVVLKYSGIDEVEYGKGHVVGNVLPACIICNRAKSDSRLDDWSRYTHTNPAQVLKSARRLGEQLKKIKNGRY